MYMHRRVYKWTEAFVHRKHATMVLAILFYLEALLFIIPTDAMLIVYCIEHQKKALWYALVATIASVLGGITGYWIGYFVWQSMGEAIIHNPWINYILKPSDFYYLCQLYKEHEYIAIFTAGFTPIPYKAATLTAGFCSLSFIPFVICSFFARGARFFLYAITIALWGQQIKEYIDRFFDLLVILVLVIILFSIWFWTY